MKLPGEVGMKPEKLGENKCTNGGELANKTVMRQLSGRRGCGRSSYMSPAQLPLLVPPLPMSPLPRSPELKIEMAHPDLLVLARLSIPFSSHNPVQASLLFPETLWSMSCIFGPNSWFIRFFFCPLPMLPS